MASEVQRAFLPQSYPAFPRDASPEDSALRFAHLYRPSGAVGGDLVSVVPLSDTRAGVMVCDVMGHGVRSGLVTAVLYAMVMELAPQISDPGELLTEMNRGLTRTLRQMPEMMFTTASYITVDAADGRAEFASAGHPKALLLRPQGGKVERLMTDGPAQGVALALYEDTAYETSTRDLGPGDRVVMFTDGLFEVVDRAGQSFGQGRLREVLARHRDEPSDALLDRVMNEVSVFAAEHGFTDDVCLACVELAHLL
jgi:sigma-B regulation protein RsbU (phosphoserine phosphatase)